MNSKFSVILIIVLLFLVNSYAQQNIPAKNKRSNSNSGKTVSQNININGSKLDYIKKKDKNYNVRKDYSSNTSNGNTSMEQYGESKSKKEYLINKNEVRK